VGTLSLEGGMGKDNFQASGVRKQGVRKQGEEETKTKIVLPEWEPLAAPPSLELRHSGRQYLPRSPPDRARRRLGGRR
jgi:hypothetical protein